MSDDSAGAIGNLEVDTCLVSGRHIRIRAVSPDDEPMMRAGLARMSPQARYYRFFSGASELPDSVIERLLSVDGSSHLAWGALDCDDPEAPAIAVVHAIRSNPEDLLEFSAVVLDDYQGEGISKLLSVVLFAHCLAVGETCLAAHVLEANVRSKTFVRHLGGERIGAEANVAEYRIDVAAALATLRRQDTVGSEAVFEALAPYLSSGSA